MLLKGVQAVAIPVVLLLQGLGVNTPTLFNFLPDYLNVFCRLWERHKNPVSWVCRPFFGLIFCYGAILENWVIILIGLFGMGSSWFWFPRLKNPPVWAEEFIKKEYQVLTPADRWDFKKVVLPSIGLPLGLAALAVLLWNLSNPWNWFGVLIIIGFTFLKIVWSARLESSVLKPVAWVTLIGFGLGAVAGALLFAFAG